MEAGVHSINRERGHELGVDAEILYTENDSITQSQQLLASIQAGADSRPHGIIFEPVGGTALPQVAQRAGSAVGDRSWLKTPLQSR